MLQLYTRLLGLSNGEEGARIAGPGNAGIEQGQKLRLPSFRHHVERRLIKPQESILAAGIASEQTTDDESLAAVYTVEVDQLGQRCAHTGQIVASFWGGTAADGHHPPGG